MSGENESKQDEASIRIKEVEDSITDYTESLGIDTPVRISKEALSTYLNMSVQDLLTTDNEELAAIASYMAMCAFHIQKEHSRQIAKAGWLERAIDKIIAPKLQSYSQYTSNKRDLAINESDYTKTLYKELSDTKQKIDSLQFLSTCLNNVCNTLRRLQATRIKIYD